jgi:hypothetical protein
MSSRFSKVLVGVVLVPALIYGALKGVMYYNAKQTVDDIVAAASSYANVSYAGISTELRGAVSVSGIRVQPLGTDDSVTIGQVRIASDDPLMFLRGASWQPGEQAPPDSLSFMVQGIELPLSSELLATTADGGAASGSAGACEQGLRIEPQLLKKVGFSELAMDLDGYYRLDEAQRTIELGMNLDLRDIESMQFSATLTDVDAEALAHGALPNLNLGRLNVAMRMSPEFGRQVLKTCATGTNHTVQAWSTLLAEQSLREFEQQGVILGSGLRKAVHDFYRDWGEVRVVAAPKQPVGLLSLMFLPPERLADALGLQVRLNDNLITDTSFRWERPDGQDLSALFGAQPPAEAAPAAAERPRRIIVRRQFERVPVGSIARYIDHEVKIKPQGLPVREGVLRRISDGQAEVEQTVHGGRYTAYVSLGEIESLQALVQREVNPE